MADIAVRLFGLVVLLLSFPLARQAASQHSALSRAALGLSAIGALSAGAALLVSGPSKGAPAPVIYLTIAFLAGAAVLGVIEVIREVTRRDHDV